MIKMQRQSGKIISMSRGKMSQNPQYPDLNIQTGLQRLNLQLKTSTTWVFGEMYSSPQLLLF